MDLTRRDVLIGGCTGTAAVACALLTPCHASAGDQAMELIEELVGGPVTASSRIHLRMPASFPTGYTVPLDLEVDSAMSMDDHVRRVRVFAPENPLIEVVGFNFTPGNGVARVSTRIRLAAPQYVVAVAEMNDGRLLVARTWVDVASNGCT